MCVTSASGKQFVLERERFPTNARKTGKIAHNRAVKFDKVSAKIVEKVCKASPAVERLGV